MGCIYSITNKINGKVYVGQTIQHPLARFGRHITDAYGRQTNDMHREIAKYGLDKFEVKILEDNISKKDLSKREQYYIGLLKPSYNSFLVAGGISEKQEQEIMKLRNKGLTLEQVAKETRIGVTSVMRVFHKHGIRRRNTVDKEKICELYKNGLSSGEVAKKMNISKSSVLIALKEENIKTRGVAKAVEMLDKQGNVLKSFESCRQAGLFVMEEKEYKNLSNCSKTINGCCNGVIKSAYGYRWRFLKEEDRYD